MKKSINYVGGLLAAALLIGTVACSSSPQAQYQQAQPVQYQQAAQAPDPGPQAAPVDPNMAAQQAAQNVINPADYPQPLSAFTCPVAPAALQSVLRGDYGVDGLGRPVNGEHFLVDYYGNCIPAIAGYPLAPVVSIYQSPVTYPGYLSYWQLHFGFGYVYNPGYFYHYPGSVVIIHSRPIGRVTVVQNYHPSSTVVVNKTVTKTTVVNNSGPSSRLPGKVGATSQGVAPSRLPGKVGPGVAPAPAANNGFRAPAQAAPASNGFRAPAQAAPASNGFRAPAQAAPASNGFRAPAQAAPASNGFRAPTPAPRAPASSGFRAPSSSGRRK